MLAISASSGAPSGISGSVKPWMRSMTRSAGRSPNPIRCPKPREAKNRSSSSGRSLPAASHLLRPRPRRLGRGREDDRDDSRLLAPSEILREHSIPPFLHWVGVGGRAGVAQGRTILLGYGELLALFSGFCYASAYVSVAKSAADKGGDNGALLSVIFTAGGALAILALGGLVQGVNYGSAPGWAWFALSGLLTVIAGRALFFKSIASIGPIRAAAVNRLNPFFSVLLAATLLGERIKPLAGIGMALIAASFVVLIRQMLARHRALPLDDDPRARSGGISKFAYIFGPASAFA